MKKIIYTLLPFFLIFAACENQNADFNQLPGNNNFQNPQSLTITDTEAETSYTDTTTAAPSAQVDQDLYEYFIEDACVEIVLNDTSWTSSIKGSISDSDISIKAMENSEEDESAQGLEIQYKGNKKIKYILSGSFKGTIFLKNKKADAALILNGVNVTSQEGAGPALRFSSELRTFIVAANGTTNTLTDSRLLNQSATMYDDKKASVYSKGALIFTGDTQADTSSNGIINIINSGYKHAVYSKDYIRIAKGINLNVSIEGSSGRDCLRALNAVIIDGGEISLKGKGTIQDDESVGIKVEGEDADEDDLTVEYTGGAGFVIINGGKLTINTIAKGITAHWKASESLIGNSSYSEIANKSLLCNNYLYGNSSGRPNPFVEINGGIIDITTSGQPYEGRTEDDPSCSPEGIEAKGSLTINAGTITIRSTDDALNAGGDITINGGALYACSSQNDAIDSNGSNGITINGGTIVALGLSTPECAFDCDQNPLTINGGLVVGLGSGNYSAPGNGSQSCGVLASSNYGNANTSMALVDSEGKPVFVYTLPAASGEVMILSSPAIKTGSTYTVKKGITLTGGIKFHNLYTTMPQISGGSSSITNFTTNASNTVYTDSGIRAGFTPPARH